MPSCYEALGLVHQLWKPVPGRFKDFIAIPKPNMYQSLHTTVIGPLGERIEVQIRTAEMHKIAEEGIAAHWAYKEGKALTVSKDDEKFAWLRQLMEWQQDLKDPKEFLETVKVDLFTDEVFVFTPKGDVKSLPRGATPVDFAYAIHSDVGGRCVGAKVNGKIVPLRYKLKNGDTVEVLTSPQAHPSKDWLTFVKTSRAQQQHPRLHQAAAAREEPAAGPRAGGARAQALQLNFNKLLKTGELKKIAEELGYRIEDDLLVAVGYGKVAPHQIVQQLVPPEKLARTSARDGTGTSAAASASSCRAACCRASSRVTEVAKKLVGGSRTAAGCRSAAWTTCWCASAAAATRCRETPSRASSPAAGASRCTRWAARRRWPRIPSAAWTCRWDVRGDFKRPVTLRVLTADRPGLLADISNTFSKKGVNISQANCRATGDDRAVNTFEVVISDLKQLTDLMRTIERLQGVFSVERI